MKINISSPPQHIVETQQQEHVFSERNIMSEVRHQFITRSVMIVIYQAENEIETLYHVAENDDRTHCLWRMRYIRCHCHYDHDNDIICKNEDITAWEVQFFFYILPQIFWCHDRGNISPLFFLQSFFLFNWYFGGCVTYIYLGLSDLFRSSWPSPQMNADEIQQCNTRPCWWWWKAVITFVFNNFTSQAVQNVQGPEIHLYADGGLAWGRTLDNLEGQG